MNFIYVIHLMCWNYLIDLITHNTNINRSSNNRNNSIHCNNKGARAPPFGSLFAKKCQKSLLKMSGGHFFGIFWTFFQRQPQHQDTFQTLFGHFSGRLPGSPKRHFGTFFGHFSAISRFDSF